jgi:signal transduction histidine kinase
MSKSGLEFMHGGGEMGGRMRTFDWSTTPLGPPAGWPQSLKTIVRVMLDSRFAMWMAWGTEGRFFCNDAYLPTVGIKREWVLGARADKVWAEIWHAIGPRIDQVLTTGEATWDEGLQLFLRRSGYDEETFHTFSYSPVYDDSHQVAGMLCVVAEDTERLIGARRLSLLRELAALSTSDAESVPAAGLRMLAALAQRTADVPFAVLYLADAEGSVAQLAGCTTEPAAGRLPPAIHLDDATAPWQVAPAIRTGRKQLVPDLRQQGVSFRGPWGEPVQQALAVPLTGSGHSRPFGALVLGISTRRRLDDNYRSFLLLAAVQVASRLADTQAHLEERRRAQALAELDRAKNTFFSNVSHELRTPLTLMLGPVDDLLARGAALPDDVAGPLALVQRNGLRLLKLVNSLLDFSRIEAGRMQVSPEPTDLAAVTADLASVFRAAVEQAGLRLTVQCEPLPEPVHVDRDMWEKVVLNLLSNAFKFTFEGRIGVQLRAQGRHACLQVSDTGVGIAAADLPHIFDRFQRVAGARSRSQEGTGIGLALVRELVKLHGGSISVASEPGAGTCFTVLVPLGTEHLAPGRVPPAPAPRAANAAALALSYVDDALRADDPGPAPAAAAGSGERILVVDDNADMRTYIRRLLEPRWTVVTAADGVEALQVVEQRVPDLLITDVMMPRLDGRALLQQLRAQPATQALPVIMLSAQAGEEARVEGLTQGADDYLVKPFSARELAARVEMQLVRTRLRRMQQAADKRLADVFRHAPVGLALLRGPDHVFEFANATYHALVFDRKLVGLPLRTAFPELEGQGVHELLARVHASGQPYVGHAVPSQLMNGATGRLEQRFFDFVLQPLADEQQAITGMAVVCFDVTGLMVARRQAEDANRAKDEFIAMLGHELRNPLAPMITALHLMHRQWPDLALRERGIIERQVKHMGRLVDDLLDVTRITRGRLDLRKAVVELSGVVERAVETASPLLEQKQQQLRLDVATQGLPVLADAVRLSQAVSNLLTNAARFSGAGSMISIRAQADGDRVLLTVRDQGIGMTPAELESVFELFVQGRQEIHRPQGGLGLGLSIARSLAAMHGGSLHAASEGPGTGSTFTLTLPLALPLAQGSALAGAPEPAAGLAAAPAGARALVVDDNGDAAHSLAELLRLSGYEVLVAADGPAALSLLDQQRVDVAILDIGLPVMDGYELAGHIRRQHAGTGLRLVALTGYGQAADIRRAMEHGFDAHLVKPVDLHALYGALLHQQAGQ